MKNQAEEKKRDEEQAKKKKEQDDKEAANKKKKEEDDANAKAQAETDYRNSQAMQKYYNDNQNLLTEAAKLLPGGLQSAGNVQAPADTLLNVIFPVAVGAIADFGV